MQPTSQQEAIIDFSGPELLVEAGPGSGKTSSIFFLSKARSSENKLYLVFGRRDMEEAQRRMRKEGIQNMHITTVHSLAYQAVVKEYKYDIGDLRPSDVVENIKELKDLSKKRKQDAFILAKHIVDFYNKFLFSDFRDISELDPSKYILASSQYLQFISDKTKEIWNKMDNSDIPVTHDFYLKKYILQNPKLDYDLIICDEAQDLNPAVISLFRNQDSRKIAVGDSFQSIYQWRGSANLFNLLDWPVLPLSESFRFHEEIAEEVNDVLELYALIDPEFKVKFPVIGKASKDPKAHLSNEPKAIIGRSNGAIISKAIGLIEDGTEYIHFVGKVKSYLFGQINIFDIYNLFIENKSKIQDPYVGAFSSIEDLKEHAEEIQDIELLKYINLVNRYKRKLPLLIKQLQNSDCAPSRAEVIVSTAHKMKGGEANHVTLLSDFITPERILEKKSEISDKQKLLDTIGPEINLRYVASSRAKQILE